jgi:hypothetical protein
LAFASSAVRKAIASQQNAAGAVAGSVLGALAESLLNAQFSQQEEREADDFGVAFMEREGYGRKPRFPRCRNWPPRGSIIPSGPAIRPRMRGRSGCGRMR